MAELALEQRHEYETTIGPFAKVGCSARPQDRFRRGWDIVSHYTVMPAIMAGNCNCEFSNRDLFQELVIGNLSSSVFKTRIVNITYFQRLLEWSGVEM